MLTITITAADVTPEDTLVGLDITSNVGDPISFEYLHAIRRITDRRWLVIHQRQTWTLGTNIGPLLIEAEERDTIASLVEWLGESNEDAAKRKWIAERSVSEREAGEQEFRAESARKEAEKNETPATCP